MSISQPGDVRELEPLDAIVTAAVARTPARPPG
jgi:hypothetical protein